jgi:4-alpha-glucanotransferase
MGARRMPPILFPVPSSLSPDVMKAATDRASGVLLHPSSLPGRGIGTLGDAAYRFIDWLADAGQSLWQVLPLVPVNEGGSPYNGLCAVGGNPMLVDVDALCRDGLVPESTLAAAPAPGSAAVDYAAAADWNRAVLAAAQHALPAAPAEVRAELDEFRHVQADWLDDLSLFLALREHHGGAAWTQWPDALRRREPAELRRWAGRLAADTERHALGQYLFARQWSALRSHADHRGVRIVGDIPIFVAHDSADVWARRELFRVDADGNPEVVSGVPPDYFSRTGQRWGNPLYRWDVMHRLGYPWWKARFRRTLEQVDVVRIDHFRGFEAFWEIPADAETAVRGEWRPGPGADLFREVERELGALPLIAEDLGLITAEVEALRDELGLPGMRVLQFAFDGDATNPHLPENHVPRAVAYAGTHDNDTLVGWWHGAEAEERERVAAVLEANAAPLHWRLLRLVWRSRANWAIAQVQDVLGLGSESRMNSPGTTEGNWAWRLDGAALTRTLAAQMREETGRSGRLQHQPTESRR